MKKLLTILLAVVMLIGAMSLSASAAMPSTYYAPYGTPTVDGVVSDGEWDAAAYTELENVISQMPLLEAPKMKIMHDGTDMYVLLEVATPDPKETDIVVCAHVPHEDCTLDGCKSYIKFIIDGERLLANEAGYYAWCYWADYNLDGQNDMKQTPDGGETTLLSKRAYGHDGEMMLYAELKVTIAYGAAIPVGESVYVDVRVDDASYPPQSSHTWANQAFVWDAQFNPATDAGKVVFLAEGEEVPVQTEPVETEPVTTEPEETETTEEQTEEETEPTTDADETPEEESAFPVVPVVIAVVVVLAVIVGIIIAKKKKD